MRDRNVNTLNSFQMLQLTDGRKLQGKYERSDNPGYLAAEIRGDKVIWPDGATHKYSVDGDKIYMYYDGEPFHAKIELNDRQPKLSWSDGDIWTRKTQWDKSQRREKEVERKLSELWDLIDKNADGRITMTEFMTQYPSATTKLFGSLDADQNGWLDAGEFRQLVVGQNEADIDVLLNLISNDAALAQGPLEIPISRDAELGWGNFSESDPTIVLLRTERYLQTKSQKHKATRSDDALATFIGAEIFRGTSTAPDKIVDLMESQFGYHIQRDNIKSERFYIVINNRVTAKKTSVVSFWYLTPEILEGAPSFEKLWWQFVYGNDEFRNSRFKCYPKIVKGSYMLKMMVPNVPTLLGQKVPITYHRGNNYIEIDIECDNNYLASSITKVAYPIAKSLTVDQSYILQAEEMYDLPEIVFAGVRYQGVNLSKAIEINN